MTKVALAAEARRQPLLLSRRRPWFGCIPGRKWHRPPGNSNSSFISHDSRRPSVHSRGWHVPVSVSEAAPGKLVICLKGAGSGQCASRLVISLCCMDRRSGGGARGHRAGTHGGGWHHGQEVAVVMGGSGHTECRCVLYDLPTDTERGLVLGDKLLTSPGVGDGGTSGLV